MGERTATTTGRIFGNTIIFLWRWSNRWSLISIIFLDRESGREFPKPFDAIEALFQLHHQGKDYSTGYHRFAYAEEKNRKTAYTYFFEAFNAVEDDPRAVFSLNYMLLWKIMVN